MHQKLNSSTMHSGKSTPKRVPAPKADLHICGACNQKFIDLTLFIEHKTKLCEALSLSDISATETDDHQQEQTQAFHIHVEEVKSEQMESHQEFRRQTVLHSLPLTENTKSKTTSVNTLVSLRRSAETDKGFVQSSHLPKKQYHIMADEDVAAILANQLSNEVISLPARESHNQKDLSNESEIVIYHQDETPLALQEIVISQGDDDDDDVVEETETACEDSETLNGDLVSLAPKKRHECGERNCNFSTTYLKDLVRHSRTHTGERPYICTLCSRSFGRSDKLQQHQRIHIGIKPHRCHLCDYSAIDGGSLKKHARTHNNERPFKCQMCSYCSRDSSQLTVHLRRHTGDQPFVCNYEACTSAFKTSSDLKRHVRIHTGEKPYQCAQCEYTCSIKSNLAVHIRINHETSLKRPGCKKCDFIATDRLEARKHAKIHTVLAEVLQCGVCEFTSVNSTTMRNHLKTHGGGKPVVCKFCNYTCWNLSNLKRHLKTKHTMYTSSSSQDDGKAPDVKLSDFKSHRCPCCNVAFMREDSWRCHVRQHATGAVVTSKHAIGAEYIVPEPKAEFDLGENSPLAGQLVEKVEYVSELTSQQILDSSSLQSNTMYLYLESDSTGENQHSTTPVMLSNQVHFVTLSGGQETLEESVSTSSAECVVLARHFPDKNLSELDKSEPGSVILTRMANNEKSNGQANNSVIKRF